MDALTQLVSQASDFLWNVVLIIILCGTGIYYTIRLKFIQVRKFREGWHQVFGNFSLSGKKKEKSGNEGEMTSFQSVATAIAAQVGTGNLAGAATALIGGGPGAIFWMWMSAFFGMSTIYAEATLAQQYKTTKDGQVTGGPVYYIRAAFQGKFGKVLAGIFAVLIIIALGFTGTIPSAAHSMRYSRQEESTYRRSSSESSLPQLPDSSFSAESTGLRLWSKSWFHLWPGSTL